MLIVLTAVPCGSSILQGAAGIYTKETPASNSFNIFFEGVNAYKTRFVIFIFLRPLGHYFVTDNLWNFNATNYLVHWNGHLRVLFFLSIFEPKRDEVTGEWRKLHNEELSDLYSLPNIVRVVKSRRMRWAGHVARMGEGRGVHRVLVGKPEGKRPLGRPRRRWEDNIKMNLQEVGGGCEDWMELAQNRDRWRKLVSTVMNIRVPKMRGISWLAAEPVRFSRRTLLHGVSK